MDAPDQVNAFLMAGVLAPGGPVGPDGRPDVAAIRSGIAALADNVLSNSVIEDVVGIHYEQSNAELAEEAVGAASHHDGYDAPAGETH